MENRPILLESLPWPEVARAREKSNGMLILPVGATEQHGPHLPINTDTVIANRICEFASALSGVPMLPPLAFTVSSGHTAKWPGTFSLSHDAFIQSICDLAEWSVRTGWTKLIFVNSHFGNDASLRVAIEKIRLDYLGTLQVGLQHTFKLSDSIWEYFISDAEDLHANKAETDLLLHLSPESVRMHSVEDDPDRTEGTVFSYPVAQTSLNGVTGAPSAGSAARGRELFEEMGTALASILRKGQSEEPPLAGEHWESLQKESGASGL